MPPSACKKKKRHGRPFRQQQNQTQHTARANLIEDNLPGQGRGLPDRIPDLRSRRHVPVCFFFNDTATTEIYTLSLRDALPIFAAGRFLRSVPGIGPWTTAEVLRIGWGEDRKSTRLNSSHMSISYAVFCLK